MNQDDAGDAEGGDSTSGQPQAAPTTIAAGVRIGDLELIREVGRGAQGIVYEGRQLGIGRTVAVKVVNKDQAFGEEQVERFRREAEATGRLSHPNVVAVYGLLETEHHMLLLQEFVEGGSLADRLEDEAVRGVPDAERCRRATEVCRKLAEALHHAHEHGVIHRDVKPDNVLFTEDGEPKLTDFGLARMENKLGLSRTGAIIGTPHYMSPEQVTADPSAIDARTDVYSLGCMLYRVLSGRVPIEGKSLQGTFHNILSMPPRGLRGLNKDVSADLEAVCLKALRKSPGERYATAEEMARDLARHQAGETTLARPEGFTVRSVRLVRRQSSPTLAVLALLIPTAWIALDTLGLRVWLDGHDAAHPLRLGLLGLCTLALAWPLQLLARRLLGHKAWVPATAWMLALALGGSAGWALRDEHLDGLQAMDRDELVLRLEREPSGSRPDVGDLQAYAATWGSRFEPQDVLLMARGYLKRERPQQAAQWADELPRELADSPVLGALRMAIDDTLGRVEAAAEAEAQLARGADADWADWKLAGDVLRDMGRPDAAYAAYLTAGRQPGAARDALNLELAEVSADLCHWSDLGEYLEDYVKWFPDDPQGRLVLYQAAAGQRRWDLADEFLDQYAGAEGVASAEVVRLRHELWALQDRRAECWALVQRAIDEHADHSSLLGWCAQQALDEQRRALADAAAASAVGDDRGARDGLARASAALDVAASVYQRLGEREEGRFTSELGLAATAIKRADVESERRLEWLEQAVVHATTARDLDPSYWQAHYNLGHATLNAARTRAGSFAAVPLDVLQDYVAAMRAAIELNGLEYQPLNNAAFVLGRYVYGATRDAQDLAEALELARRAVRLTDPARGGRSCAASSSALSSHSSAYDTLRSLQELAGDERAALASARAAHAVLAPDAPEVPRRLAEVERLERLTEGR